MHRACAALAVLLGLASPAWADEPTVTPGAIGEIATEVQFRMLVVKGDQERAKGHLVEAATAYAQALQVHRDPLIAGRLGVLLVQVGEFEKAPELLLDAMHLATDASPEERLSFMRAYDKAQAQGAWIEVMISHAGAKLTLDGQQRNKDGHSTVFLFLLAGDHELRATLEGYEAGFAKVTVSKGEKARRVPLTLKPLPNPVREVDELLRRHSRAPVESPEDPPKDEPERREPIAGGVEGAPRADKPRVMVGGGPVVVFGVASWQPAVGPMAGVSWGPKEYFSLGIEGRAAWLTSGIEGMQINAMTAGGIASACGHWRWLFGCALGYVGTVNVNFTSGSYEEKSFANVQPGGGARIGVQVRFGPSFIVQGNVDALALSRGTKVVAGKTLLVDQPPFMFNGQVLGGWEF